MTVSGKWKGNVKVALNSNQVKSLQAGVHADGGGLYLVVRESGDRVWAFRFTDLEGKRAQMEFARAGDRDGASGDVLTLSSAREKARDYKVALKREGIDPRVKKRVTAQGSKTFKEFAEEQYPDWCQGLSEEELKQWQRSIRDVPSLHDKKLQEITTEQVLEAAGTKWNFLPFRPGLVGGHCIGVDPYYLTHKAQEIGYHPEMILAGRRLNDNMALHVAGQITQLMAARRIHVKGARALVLGITFKENCPDIRNSKVVDVVRELQKQGAQVDIYDPWASRSECRHEYGLQPVRALKRGRYDVAIVAVAHRQFRELGVRAVRRLCKTKHVLYDIKHVFAAAAVDGRL